MTTIVQARQPLQVLSMNTAYPERRHSKRLRSSAVYEEDGDFQFMRVPKRAKTVEEPEVQQPQPTSAPAPVPIPAQPVKRGRGRPPRTATILASAEKPASATTKRSTRRKPGVQAPIEEVDDQEDGGEGEGKAKERERQGQKEKADHKAVAPRRTVPNARDSEDSFLDVLAEPTPAPAPQPKGRPSKRTQKQASVAATPAVQGEQAARKRNVAMVEDVESKSQKKGGGPKAARPMREPSVPPVPISVPKPPPPPPPQPEHEVEPASAPQPQPRREPQPEPEPEPEPQPEPTPMEIDSTPPSVHRIQPQPPPHGVSPEHAPARIALPISDTPVIDRNKEMRKKAGSGPGTGGGRRSSLGMRGRRASSLIENGHTALPHRDVDSAEFYKHLAGDGGLPEPRRMKVLLTWCGERALSEKPPLGSANPHALLGARAIEKQLLKDFGVRGELSDWFRRDITPDKEVVMKPNPKNIEHDEKIAELEQRVKRLREEKQAWLALRKPPPAPTPLFSSDDETSFELPDVSQVDEDDADTLRFLTDPSTCSQAMASSTRSRLSAVTSALGFRIDQLSDGVLKLEMRVATAGRETDSMQAMCADSLKRREEREKACAGTKNLPVMEVLRSLGRMLPPETDSD